MTMSHLVVNFNSYFLNSAKEIFSEEEMKKLSFYLGHNAFGGHLVGGQDHLFYIEWQILGLGKTAKYHVWYVADEKLPHIEVVALTESSSKVEVSKSKLFMKCAKIAGKGVSLIYLIKKLYDLL